MRNLLKAQKKTQVQVATALGVTQSLISQWVRGVCEPRIEQIPLIAAALDVSVEQVVECFTKKKKGE